jgi:hypothetical protein
MFTADFTKRVAIGGYSWVALGNDLSVSRAKVLWIRLPYCLGHPVRDRKVGGSNPLAPTISS